MYVHTKVYNVEVEYYRINTLVIQSKVLPPTQAWMLLLCRKLGRVVMSETINIKVGVYTTFPM